MSSGHVEIQKALRVQLLTLSVCTTGTTILSATTTGYARTTGSFVTDGFAVGMEVTPSGFTNTATGVITAVSALVLTIAGGRSADAVASGRSLSVGLPSLRAWENLACEPVPGVPYFEEQYVPGPEGILIDGFAGLLELRPMYSPRIYVPSNTGISGDGKYADAIRRLFAPGTTMALGTGESLVVRADVAPFLGQRAQRATAGWSTIPVTIPLSARLYSVPS